jgi:hypothetical protein
MNPVSVVFKINNGFLIVNPDGEDAYFTPHWDPATVAPIQPIDHEGALRKLVLSIDPVGGKIPAIRTVRRYCTDNNYSKYIGLKDAKDYVESLRDWQYAYVDDNTGETVIRTYNNG